ncbi:T9SS type A sorting domain-containing protein [Flavitalea sp. BT771]|uniref:T9SS type A sorting domain-containing protein n=1 Tax=Flavitalea sp. BT771 TaxID=3063329 RepID=UPI0026E29371|nr:T9SS type A sorting domain-containing protein [Flavitalea sp. BT771]MDO6434220.1 T9SS type A sorting domain-containing protein [Flavitalea sp. BT771]MDV6223120.1 T9SS type A sorting domain-containing protein [Flavitalea sp. BT771]
MKPSFHLILAVSLLMAHTCYATAPSIGTTNFNSLTTGALFAGASSPATASNVGSLGWNFTLSTDGGFISASISSAGVTGASDVCIRMNRSTLGFAVTSLATLSNDGSAFKLNHAYLKVNLFSGASADMTLTGYRNGTAVTGAIKTITGITTSTWTNFDVSAIAAFSNVTEFRFTQAGSTSAVVSFAVIDEIDISAAVPLPLTLDLFSGQRQDNTVLLHWTTLLEQNTAWFEIQRAADATNYEAVGKVRASGNSRSPVNYAFVDDLPAPAAPRYFYRLKMADMDGRFTYSPIISIGVPSGALDLTAYPNPMTNTTTLTVPSNTPAIALLTVTDMYGRKILVRSVHLQKGNNILPLLFFQGLGKGIYQLSLATHEKTGTVRLLKTD